MFNAGAAGLQAMKDEADALGIVMDTNTARAAENFNDNLTRLTRVKDGLIMKITGHLLPALENLSEQMINFANDGESVQAVAETIGEVFQWVAKQAAQLVGGIRGIKAEIASLAEVGARLTEFDFSGARDAWNRGQDEAVRIRNETVAAVEQLTSGMATSQAGIQRRISDAFGESGAGAGEAFVANFEKATSDGGGRARAALDPMAREAARIFEGTRTPLERYQAQIARLNELLAAGAINQDTYNRAVLQAQDAFEQAEKAGKKSENVFQQIGQTIGQTFASAFSSIIDGSRKVGDVIADLMRQLGQMLLSRAFQSLMGFLFPGSAPILNSGGGFGGLIGYNANGTNSWRGGLTAINERGGEIIDLPKGSRVIPHDVSMAMARNGGGTSVVQVQLSPDLEARILQEAGNQSVQITQAGFREFSRGAGRDMVKAVVNDPRAVG